MEKVLLQSKYNGCSVRSTSLFFTNKEEEEEGDVPTSTFDVSYHSLLIFFSPLIKFWSLKTSLREVGIRQTFMCLQGRIAKADQEWLGSSIGTTSHINEGLFVHSKFPMNDQKVIQACKAWDED